MIFQSFDRLVESLPITVSGQPDVWRDIYRVDIPVEIPAGAIIRVHLVKQLENPSAMPANVAWLREFYIRESGGQETRITIGGNPNTSQTLGMNITRNEHYDTTMESCIYLVPADLSAGCSITYRGRARTSTIRGHKIIVWNLNGASRSCMTVEIDNTQQQIDALTARIAKLEIGP